jgi:hypothetical protein
MSRPHRFRRGIATLAALGVAAGLGPLVATAGPAAAAGAVSLTNLGTPYTEDFNTLASTGTSSVVPTGWDFSESGTNANTTYTAGTGSSNTGDTYSFGASGNTERAFGGLRSGNLVPLVGAQFTNSTGVTITSLSISYTGEQWRLGQNTAGRAADRLDFQLSADATSITTGTWSDYDSLDFSSPVVSGTVGALNGNDAANRTALSYTISGLALAPGSAFWIRWADSDLIPGADDGLSIDDFSLTPAVSDTAPAVTSTFPVNGATDVPVSANLTVTFSEPVNVTTSWYTLSCSISGDVASTYSGGPTTFTIDPSVSLVDSENCTLTVLANQVTDQDGNDPPDNMVANFVVGFTPFDLCAQPYTRIYDIQGSGLATPIPGTVTTQGIVVGDYEGASPALRGFFIQDPTGDGNAATSDGIFVFNGNSNAVSLGDVVRVSGTAAEFQDQTQISSVTSITACGTGTVTPTDVTFPVASATALEQYEGMLVRLPQTMYVTEHFQLGRFGQVVVSANARLQQPTNVVAPGAPALALQAENNLNRIIIDDALNNQNPDPIVFGRGGMPLSASNTLRGGDTATNTVGVMTYTWAGNSASGNAYRVRPINALNGSVMFEPTNPRPAGAPEVGGSLQVAGMNVLNFFNTFDGSPDTADNCTLGVGGAATDCRGADTQLEFDRQVPKTVAAILGTGADVVGLNEIENDGYGPTSALAELVDELNAVAGAGTWAYIDADAATGELNALGTDAIKVALIYKPAMVTPVGQTAALNTEAFVNGGDGAPRSRPALAQAFVENTSGGMFVAVVNHLKSKGSACDLPDQGDGQGNCNQVRLNAVNELMAWLDTDPTGTGDSDHLLVGDLNSYAKEDPVTALVNGGYTNLVEEFVGPDAYSYVFDGQWGYLDHALGSTSIVPQVTGVAEWHINSDEPSVLDFNTNFKSAGQIASLYAPDEFRTSDHDPVIIGLNLTNAPPVVGPVSGPMAPVMVGTPVSVSSPFTDADALDTHSATIDWGDGTTTAATVTEANGTGTVTGSHAYAAAGIYKVTVTVADDWGNKGSAEFKWVIVYDPSAGFVTGGGWITSPAGSYLADPMAEGKSSLGFVARYNKGDTAPKGNLAFSFPTAGMELESTGLEWLVVSGSKATFAGSAMVNDMGGYRFVAWATDGRPDRFRLKVWDASNTVVYDSSTRTVQGQIRIHS